MSNSNQIENLAAGQVQTLLNTIEGIDTAINTKDKHLSFDGYIVLYNSSIFKKSNV